MTHHLNSFTEAQLERYNGIQKHVQENNGYTSQIYCCGYMVALYSTEIQISVSALNTHMFNRLCDMFERWSLDNQCNWGIWSNDGKLYFDLSVNVSDLNEALKFGQQNQQLAIWDCKSSRCISLVDGLE